MKRLVAGMMHLLGKRTCEEVVAVLQDYFEGSLAPQLKGTIERHFEGCPDCKAFASQYVEIIRLGAELSCDDIPPEVRLRVRHALREHSRSQE